MRNHNITRLYSDKHIVKLGSTFQVQKYSYIALYWIKLTLRQTTQNFCQSPQKLRNSEETQKF